MSERQRIGTVEVLQLRIYQQLGPQGREVVVNPGTYPLYREGSETYWEMEGVINAGNPVIEKIDDGLFTMERGDKLSDEPATVESPRFNPEDWDAFLKHEVCTEGHWGQRLRIELTDA